MTAEYYFTHSDYPQALKLWTEVLTKDPTNDTAVGRVAQLQLFFEGRQAARDGLARYLASHGEALPRESRRLLLERWRVIQTSFLTEEGQSLYLQAREKETQGDCPAAVALVSRALVLEKGNTDLLKFRARCEFKTENFAAHYETLKQANGEYPFDLVLQEELAEAHLRFQQPQRVVEMWDGATEPFSTRKRLALAFSLLDTGADARATALAPKVGEPRATESPWAFLLGALAVRRGNTTEAASVWEGFLKGLEGESVAASDPYRLKDRAEEARAWLARRIPPKSGPPVTKNAPGNS